MSHTTVSSKGQVVLPKEVRDQLGWKPGTKLQVVASREGVTLRTRDPIEDKFPPITWEEFMAGRVKIDRFPTEAEIEETVLAEAARRFDAARR